MSQYEELVKRDLYIWRKKILKPANILQRSTKNLQNKINEKYPKKVNDMITVTVKGIIKTTLFGMDYIPKELPIAGLSLQQRDELAKELLTKYRKIAAAEGAGTGFGGIFLGAVDFPALIAIKLKFLFELAHIYGYDTHNKDERLFLLYVFQLAFSSQPKKSHLLETIEDWNYINIDSEVDWEQLQREYRDSLDLRKLLQLIPGFGAVVGFLANYSLIDDLGSVAINCYRIRILN